MKPDKITAETQRSLRNAEKGKRGKQRRRER
jgi:hypothetical protein